MFDERFLSSVRQRKFYDFNKELVELPGLQNWDWPGVINLLDTHPESATTLKPEKHSFLLTSMELRESRPKFCKIIEENLKNTFKENNISTHFFGGFTGRSKSFRIHRDVMDVLYLQFLGEIEWSVWEAKDPMSYSEKDKMNLEFEEANKIYSDRFIRGRMIWIPRGTYHLVEPYMSRVGVSFGVEGKVDPSTYV